MSPPEPLLLAADGHNLLFRSFSSVPRSITDPEGRPVNGIYGLMGTLLKLIRERRPAFTVVAFDVPEIPTFRHREMPTYQGQRGPLGGANAENFAWQVAEAQALLAHHHLPALVAPGFEADDILATLVTRAAAQGIPSLVVSNDRDLQQLVGPMVRVLVPGKTPVEVGPEQVVERLGVRADQIVDWKILAGDPSDNIPGIAGIGDRSAVELLRRFDTLRGIYAALDSLAPRQRRALEEGRNQVDKLERVIRIRTDVELSMTLEELETDYATLPERAGDALRVVGLRPE